MKKSFKLTNHLASDRGLDELEEVCVVEDTREEGGGVATGGVVRRHAEVLFGDWSK